MLSGQVALVTGASRGIGRAVAARLVREGMDAAVVARSEGALVALRDELAAAGGGRVLAVVADVADPASVRRAVASTEDAFGRIDLLVNNAGTSERDDVPLWEADADDWWDVMTTNVRGPMLFCRTVVPGMVARGSGRIVNINSLRAVHALPTQTAYGISKAALGKLTQALAAGLAGTGVRSFDYSPGRVLTELTHQLGMAARPGTSWTPMEQAVDGVVRIAEGSLDALAGRFLHAHDDWQQLAERADDVVRGAGRAWTISPAFPGDPLANRRVGAPATGSA
jgi:NAD(P)-dependent dehydrogenase (short-subunit alcohol dehydrogenase family)